MGKVYPYQKRKLPKWEITEMGNFKKIDGSTPVVYGIPGSIWVGYTLTKYRNYQKRKLPKWEILEK